MVNVTDSTNVYVRFATFKFFLSHELIPLHIKIDAHLYSNHIEQARLQLSRDFRSLPTMKINPEVKDLFAFKFEDFELEGYDPHPHIKAAVSV